jgi:hypothetical protein
MKKKLPPEMIDENEKRVVDKVCEKAYEVFSKDFKTHNRHAKANFKRFAKTYLHDKADEGKKKKYLEITLPNLSEEEREHYIGNIYCCKFCDRYFPLWYVSDADWENTGKYFERMMYGIAYNEGRAKGGPAPVEIIFEDGMYKVKNGRKYDESNKKFLDTTLIICKECYEKLFDPNPRYIDIEEREKQLPANSWIGEYPPQGYFDQKKKFLSTIWDLPTLEIK